MDLQELLEEEIDQTRLSIEKKQTRSWEENQHEIEKHDLLESQEIEKMNSKEPEKDEEEVNTNPLNIPLGYDGKPIPYWLFRLHGLGIEYKCEICGNYGYWGPKAFERHFQEWRHAHAMRCLKIPNTRHFHHITSIQEALALWKKVKSEMTQGSWDKEQEEYEDKEGNVFSKKTFNDLKRQGIIKE
jgi:splicing factor 3A subunit 3